MAEEKKDSPQPKIDFGISENFQNIYSDTVFVNVGWYDIKLTFGNTTRLRDGSIFVEDAATIIFSPQHAKEFSRILAEHIEFYEKTFGAITNQSKRGDEGIIDLRITPDQVKLRKDK